MSKFIKVIGIVAAIALLFVIINIVIVQNWHSKMPSLHQHMEPPALVYICSIQDKTARFDKILYSDGTVPMNYSKGDQIPILSNIDLSYNGKSYADALLVVVEKTPYSSGPVTNRIVNEYFIRQGIVVGLRNLPVSEALKHLGIKEDQQAPADR